MMPWRSMANFFGMCRNAHPRISGRPTTVPLGLSLINKRCCLRFLGPCLFQTCISAISSSLRLASSLPTASRSIFAGTSSGKSSSSSSLMWCFTILHPLNFADQVLDGSMFDGCFVDQIVILSCLASLRVENLLFNLRVNLQRQADLLCERPLPIV